MDHYAAQRLLYEEVPASADELSDEEEEGASVRSTYIPHLKFEPRDIRRRLCQRHFVRRSGS